MFILSNYSLCLFNRYPWCIKTALYFLSSYWKVRVKKITIWFFSPTDTMLTKIAWYYDTNLRKSWILVCLKLYIHKKQCKDDGTDSNRSTGWLRWAKMLQVIIYKDCLKLIQTSRDWDCMVFNIAQINVHRVWKI